MQTRLDFYTADPAIMKALMGVENQIAKGSLDILLKELVRLRASQINGCAFCLDMHTKDARAAGETEQRLYMLGAWREAGSMYTPRERAALGWAEAVTKLTNQEVSDAVYDEARQQFNEKELVDLTLATIAINGWNRLSIPFRVEAGHYQPAQRHKA